jgi:hypothetical protein
MAIVIGKIESLKALKLELKNKKVTRFKSVKELKDFLSNYNVEKIKILEKSKIELEKKNLEISNDLKQKNIQKTYIISNENHRIDEELAKLYEQVDLIKSTNKKTFFRSFFDKIKLNSLNSRINYNTKFRSKIIDNSVSYLSNQILHHEQWIKNYRLNKDTLIKKKSKSEIKKLEYTRKVVIDCKRLIAGAIGENLVVKEIQKLSNDFILINDFNLNFEKPIFDKKNNDRIYSVQIDHLLISKSGIFILETKNWSKSSVNSIDLRSPVSQILRSNFALYVYISQNITLNDHHWGTKNIPIKNVIVMIHSKPLTNFKFVNVKLLNELNDFINYFEPVFSDSELNKVTRKLSKANNSYLYSKFH